MAGNFKLGVTNYSRSLYGPRRVAYPGSGDDEDDDEVEVRRIQRQLLATNQGRGNNIDYLQSRHIDIPHIFLLLLLLFLFPLAKI